jgi:hypothetical protein
MFLHIIVGQNPKNLNANKTHFLISYNVIKYICAKKECHNILKNANIFNK